jgi:hypothetical protein
LLARPILISRIQNASKTRSKKASPAAYQAMLGLETFVRKQIKLKPALPQLRMRRQRESLTSLSAATGVAKHLGTFRTIRSIAPLPGDYAVILFGFEMPQMIIDVAIDVFRRDKKRFVGAVKAA